MDAFHVSVIQDESIKDTYNFFCIIFRHGARLCLRCCCCLGDSGSELTDSSSDELMKRGCIELDVDEASVSGSVCLLLLLLRRR